MPTPYQKRLIKGFEEAVREHAFMGSQPPGDHEAIEEHYQREKAKLERAFDRATAGKKPAQDLEQIVEQALYATRDPASPLRDGPAMTTMLYSICDNDHEKFLEAMRLVELFIHKALEIQKETQNG